VFKFPVSGSSWHCGGQEAWNHPFAHEYDAILEQIAANRIPGIILLGGDQHACKINVRPGHTWGGYDLREWMAGRIWNGGSEHRGFAIITVDTETSPPAARLKFLDDEGNPKYGRRVPYTRPGDTVKMWDHLLRVAGVPREEMPHVKQSKTPWDGEVRTSGGLWDYLPRTTGEFLTAPQLRWPDTR